MNPFGFGPWGAGILTIIITVAICFCLRLWCITTWDIADRICDSFDQMWTALVEIAKARYGSDKPSKST